MVQFVSGFKRPTEGKPVKRWTGPSARKAPARCLRNEGRMKQAEGWWTAGCGTGQRLTGVMWRLFRHPTI